MARLATDGGGRECGGDCAADFSTSSRKREPPEAVRQRNQLYNDSIAGDLLNHGSFSDSVIQRRAVKRA